MKLCLACFKKCEDDVKSCPHCGYGSATFTQPAMALPIGTLLQGRYMTGKAETKTDAFVYAALDKQTKSTVKIEESFPANNVKCRKGNALIYKNSDAVAETKQGNGVFSENNTYYTVITPLAAKKKKKSARSTANKIFRVIAYASSFICLIISTAFLLDYFVIDKISHRKNSDTVQSLLHNEVTTLPGVDPLEEIRKKYPGVNFPDGMNPNFAELYAQNNEFAGQLTIDGLYSEDEPFDFAVMQTVDNDKYLTVNFYGENNRYGQPYFDYRNGMKTLDRNTIIHGHNMRSDDTVFGGLEQYRDPETFKKHPIIKVKTLYGEYNFKIYAVIIVNGKTEQDNGQRFYYNFADATDVEFAKYLKELDKRKLYTTGVEITKYDKIVTLSTCCYDFKEARLAVIGRLVREGEDLTVDTSLVTVNPSPKFPQAYYDDRGIANPYKNDEHLFMVQ